MTDLKPGDKVRWKHPKNSMHSTAVVQAIVPPDKFGKDVVVSLQSVNLLSCSRSLEKVPEVFETGKTYKLTNPSVRIHYTFLVVDKHEDKAVGWQTSPSGYVNWWNTEDDYRKDYEEVADV